MTDVLPNNLRSRVTTLVGRQAELSELKRILTSRRLITIAGPGGIGKTRLAAELSEWIVRSPVDPPGGARELQWVDLSPVTAASEVADACARVLGVHLRSDHRDPLTDLVARVHHRHPVLVLDTCEHLLGPVADLVERLLHGCPGASILTTSREPLGVAGEVVWRVPALQPDDAAALFVERARLVSQDPGLSRSDPVVRAICTRLDGLPLAIELASSWTRVLTARQILDGLDERFRLLTGGSRRGDPRHRTLEASMRWSHDLLEPVERVTFRRLSVFVGDFSLSAAEEVAGGSAARDDVEGAEVVEVLARLVDKSLLEIVRVGDQVHYRMLETVRTFAAAALADAAEVASIRDAHLVWCLSRIEAIDEELGSDQESAMRMFSEVHANAVAALDWALRTPSGADRRRRGRLLAHLMTVPWFLRGDGRRGGLLVRRAMAAASGPDDDVQQLLAGDAAVLGILAGRFGLAAEPTPDEPSTRLERLGRARSGLAHAYENFFLDLEGSRREALAASYSARDTGDSFTEDFAVVLAAYTLTAGDDHHQARRLAAPAAERARDRHDRFCAAFAQSVEQYAAMYDGRLTEAVRLGREMTDHIAPLGHYFGAGFLTEHLALALCLTGDLDEARHVLAPIVDVFTSTEEIDVVALPVPMGHICLRAGDWAGAAEWFERGLAGLDSQRPDWTVARSLPGAVHALRRLGHVGEASDLAQRGQDLGIETPDFVASLTAQRAHLLAADDPLAAILHRRALGCRLRAGSRTFLPDSLDALAAVHAPDQPGTAVHLLAASTAARETMNYPRAVGDLPDHDELVEDLRKALDPGEFDEAWAAGSRTSLDDACELAQSGRRRPTRPSNGWASLTPTELAVVRLAAQGMTNPEIAEELVVSRATVKTHLYHVFTKLDVSNRTELASIAHTRLAEDPNGSNRARD
ncbi:helix-turn-helix transcriptional regulator [Tsukamurella ocularis]|uniref:helix-turn-helix transcriptional regulator n=1 Tax=Tsukamurella ocularis TaxID=1970234 RepID=UPI0039EF65F1